MSTMRYTHIFFDLDGTLTDSAPGILNSCEYALKRMGIERERKDLYVFIGPPLLESFTKISGSPEGGREGVRLYREYFAEKGIFENSVFAGVPEMLRALKDADRKLVLATAKPLVYARRILDHFDLARYFDYAGGADLEGGVHSKADVLRLDLGATGADPARVLMVGDRSDDVDAAKNLGIACAAARWGYAQPGEVDHAEYACHVPADVVKAGLEEA
ncbi:MAG: HAD hydrolase-like protein [Desulfovibrionaceae bacterium]|nr:HAD hydrolase-like protein [Desulfovibrionaceae bacterium]